MLVIDEEKVDFPALGGVGAGERKVLTCLKNFGTSIFINFSCR